MRVKIITKLYEDRRNEVNAVTSLMKNATLDNYNEWLQGFGELPVTSKTQARLILSKILINIYDLKDKCYHKRFQSYNAFCRYTVQNKLLFPLRKAKKEDIKVFLKRIQYPIRPGDQI